MSETRIDNGGVVPQSQSDRTTPYEYKPLASSNSIRIVELLRGNVGEPIQVLLHHRTLKLAPPSHMNGGPMFASMRSIVKER